MARGRLGKAVQAIDEDLTVNTFRLGIATYLRLFADVLSELLPFDRTIYLDCDVLVNQDLATLAKTEMTTPLVAAHDDQRYCDDEFRERLSMPTGAPYFNAGVMLLDLDAIRRERLFREDAQFCRRAPRYLQTTRSRRSTSFS